MTTFAERLKFYMNRANMKQTDLVEKTKINKSSISEYLSGNYEPKQRNIYKIATALGIKPSQLMGIENKEEAAPSPSLALTAREEKHIKKYRQLDADGKRDVDDFTDMKLMQAQRKADEQWEQLSPEKEELKLG